MNEQSKALEALMTPLQLKRKKRNEKIVADYKMLRKEAGKAFKEWSAYGSLGRKHGISRQGVQFILRKEGVIE
ncbi:hypothetical protein HMPREF1860_01904 [Prevotella amnii]|uniref:Uncharacterized protein n=1 Tax=Prevotella amnii TaxID=419005 RepID=A0A134B556_9BACT|nr:hypothetical protein [Prevotella amnii]KXB75075.1 hypothetical protein HMPREF1860_01904 [Prevotella amnii]